MFVPTWMFKINNEFNGRGIAWLQTDTIKNVVRLRQEKIEITNPILNKLRFVIETSFKKKVNISMPGVFTSWDQYLERFC